MKTAIIYACFTQTCQNHFIWGSKMSTTTTDWPVAFISIYNRQK